MTIMSIRAGREDFSSRGGAGETSFVFDHIPKTGGTALRAVFEEIFGADQVSPHVSTRSEAWARQNFASYRMVTGHFLSLRNEAPDDGRTRLTILRHPLDRAISEYYWYRHDTDAVAGGDVAPLARAYDFDEYLVERQKKKEGTNSNAYARHFAGQLSRDVADDKQILSLAKEALSRYDFVGITEALTDTVDFFCCEYDLALPREVPRANATSSRKALAEIDPATLRRLENLYELDLELYQLALTGFQSRKRRILQNLRAAGNHDAAEAAATGGTPAGNKAAGNAPQSARPARTGMRRSGWLHYLRSPRGDTIRPAESEAKPASAPIRQEPAPRRAENFGNKQVEIVSARVTGDDSGERYVRSGEQINITLALRAHISVTDLTVGIAILDSMGEIAFGTNSYLLGAKLSVQKGKRYEVTFRCRAGLNKDYYFINASAHTGAVHTNCCFHWFEHVTELDVVDSGEPPFEGYARLEPEVILLEQKA